MISKNEVKHIAKLARLELTEKEIEEMQKDMSAILDYFDLLKKAPKLVKEGPAFAKATVWQRKDEAMAVNPGLTKKLIEAFPNKKDDYIKVRPPLNLL